MPCRIRFILILVLPVCLLSSCVATKVAGGALKATGKVAKVTAKAGWVAAKTTGKAGAAGVRYATGKRVVILDKRGNSYYVNARLNKRHNARLLLDTGASSLQVSTRLAQKMGLNTSRGKQIRATLADGSVVTGRRVILKEVKAGGAKAKNVEAVVLDVDAEKKSDGLLGMSFLGRYNFSIDTDKNLLVLRKK